MTGERGKRLARRMLSCFRKAYGRPKTAVRRSPIEEILIGVIADGCSERRAEAAVGRLRDEFVDWNEVRVGTAADIAAFLSDARDPMASGEHVRRILERMSERSSDLDPAFLAELAPHEAAGLVDGIPGFPEPAISRVTLLQLGHDTCPPTVQVVALCRRIGLLGDGDGAAMAGQIRKLVPKAAMYEFHALAYYHAANVCRDGEPACAECVLRFDCRTWRVQESKDKRKRKARPARAVKPAPAKADPAKTKKSTKKQAVAKADRSRSNLKKKKAKP